MTFSREKDLVLARRLFWEDVVQECVVGDDTANSAFRQKVEAGIYDDSPEIRLILRAIEVTRKEYQDQAKAA